MFVTLYVVLTFLLLYNKFSNFKLHARSISVSVIQKSGQTSHKVFCFRMSSSIFNKGVLAGMCSDLTFEWRRIYFQVFSVWRIIYLFLGRIHGSLLL